MKFTLEEFKEIAKDVGADKIERYKYGKNILYSELGISWEWRSGGMWGGDCWGLTPTPVDPDSEPDPEILTNLLEKTVPNLTFLQYNKLTKFIKSYEYSISEYYGNYSNYTAKYIDVEELYNYLKEL